MDTIAYKILTKQQMDVLEHDGEFAGAPIDLNDGYVHLSTAGQAQETLEKHFAGQSDLWIAAVDLEALRPAANRANITPELVATELDEIPADSTCLAFQRTRLEWRGTKRPTAGA